MEDRRSRTLVKKEFQNRILRIIIVSLVTYTVVALAVFYIALMVKVNQAGLSGYTEDRLAELFSWIRIILPLIGAVLILAAGFVGRKISFKVAGPLYALERQLRMILDGEIESVQVRSSDNDLIPLAGLINQVIEKKKK